MLTGMPQIVGLPCVLCRTKIETAIDGRFCDACGCPVHVRCATPRLRGVDSCAKCGAPAELAAEHRQRSQRQTASFDRAYLGHRVSWGIVEIAVGVLALGVGGFIFLGSLFYGPVIILFGLTTTVHGAVLLWRRKPRGPKDL